MGKKYHLFEVYGIELEYMVVQKSSLKIAPIVDALLTKKNGSLVSDMENGAIAWSNELVAHVIEIKTNGPTANLIDLANHFHENVLEMNAILQKMDAYLLPTASHPLMNPNTETTLWKHSYNEVYELYNRIFNCKGHGWSNVQSTHINLPFYDDAEFEKLHAAIRVLLPIIPGLSASSPILEGKKTGFKDTRLEYYKTNQKEIPEMTGLVIPENVFSKKEYYATIFEPIQKAIQPFDTQHILDHHFLNSRGAISRFDRNAIEIRLVDIQECPKVDIAICTLIIEILKVLVDENLSSLIDQKKWKKEPLFVILNGAIQKGENAEVINLEYLNLFGLKEACTIQEVWQHLFSMVKKQIPASYQDVLAVILSKGTLSTRILKAVDTNFSEKNIKKVYTDLATCLQKNIIFNP